MAAKKSSSGRASSSAKKKSASRSKKSADARFPWESEVLLFVVLIFCVLLFIANLNQSGSIGRVLSDLFFGLFGVMSYAFPIALFLLVAFLVSNYTTGRKSKYHYPGRAVLKTLAGIFCFVFLCVICQTIHFGQISYGPRGNYAVCSSGKVGGGMIGGLLSTGMVQGIGTVATYVISFLILAFCVILMMERAPFRGLFRKYYNSVDEARTRNEKSGRNRSDDKKRSSDDSDEKRREAAPVADAEKKENRRDRKVSGVTRDLDLKTENREAAPPAGAGDTERMSEIDLSDIDYGEDLAYIEEEKNKKTTENYTQSMQEVTEQVAGITGSIAASNVSDKKKYIFPPSRLLKRGDAKNSGDSRQYLAQMAARLQDTLDTFGVNARVTNVVCGPSVTRYEVQPELGVKVRKITDLENDIKLNMMASYVRIEAPIPGKAAIGIEIPNKENVTVALRDLIESPEYRSPDTGITFCVGKDIAGHIIVGDITKMPHLLIAGATGSGKSVCINTIIMSILFKYTPDEVRLIMIDPKVVELSVYNDIPHLMIPVVTDPKMAAGALHWAVAEMTERYNRFAESGVRDIDGYNLWVDSLSDADFEEGEERPQRMPSIVIIVDELSDLMMVAKGDVEDAICRLAQLARAAGLHLIIATQRPSVNVITGLIKANMPSRIAFAVTSIADSRTILDMKGAESLLGKGDMLYDPQGYAKPIRVQGAFVSDAEVARVVADIVEKNGQVSFDAEVEDRVVRTSETTLPAAEGGFPSTDGGRDQYFDEAARFLIEKEKGSIGMLQRNFKIGFNRAARIMDQLEDAGIVGPEEGTKPRRVLVTLETYEETCHQ